jgi:hypothetical protein
MYCQFQSDDGLQHACAICGKTLQTRFRHASSRIARICSGRPLTAAPKGPGDYLHAMIRYWTGEDIERDCQCEAWIDRMNAWGPAGCREHLNEIVAHMLSEAKKRGWKLTGMPGAKTVVGLAVRRACRMAEKAEAARAN